MKTSRIVHIATLALAVGFVALASAAQDRPSNDKDRPKQDNKQQQAKPDQHAQPPSSRQEQPARQQQRQPAQSQERRPAQQQRPNESPQRAQQQPRQAPEAQLPTVTKQQEHTRQQRGAAAPQQNQGRGVQQSAWQQHRASNWQSDHRTWQQRGGYHGYRVPDARYRGYFGSGHAFLIRGLPFMVVGGFPRFQYNGYWLSVVDPWPQQWGNDWYDNDQVYVDYSDGGYYLYNRSYPGVGIAVSISM